MSKKECKTCLGLGFLPIMRPPMPCPECNGLGYIEEDDEEELQPCACGNHNLQVYHTVLDGWVVYCPECGYKVDENIDRASAIEYWNSKNS